MVSDQDHLSLASHNASAIEFLLQGGDAFADWVATIAFYQALHLVDALLYRDGRGHGIDHASRLDILKRANRYKKIYRHYRPLSQAATIARYLEVRGSRRSYSHFVQYMPMEQVVQTLLKCHLSAIEKSITGLLAKKP